MVHRTIRYEANVVSDQIAKLSVLPGVKFDAKTRVKTTESQSSACFTECIGSNILKHKYHSICSSRVNGSEVHAEVELEGFGEVDLFAIPNGSILIALWGSELITVPIAGSCGSVQEVGLSRNAGR